MGRMDLILGESCKILCKMAKNFFLYVESIYVIISLFRGNFNSANCRRAAGFAGLVSEKFRFLKCTSRLTYNFRQYILK